jgi:porin
MDNWDFKLKADAAKLWGWADTTAYLHVISQHGGRFNARIAGSFMGVDGIEAGTNTTKVFHAWLERTLLGRRLSLLAGLYPLDSEFYLTEASGMFLHPGAGMAAEVAQTGVNGPSIFPTSSFGVRARWRPATKLSVLAALVDGVPGNPRNPRGTHVRFERGDGTLAIVEFGLEPLEQDVVEPLQPERGVPQEAAVERHERLEAVSHYAVGYWRYSARFDDLVDRDALGRPMRRVNRGAYIFGEQTVYREAADPAQGLVLFARYGVASSDVNVLQRSSSLGLRYRGLVEGRSEDEFGILWGRGDAGAKFQQVAPAPVAASETVLEITYRARVASWLSIQPVLQRIVHPGLVSGRGAARIAGARFEIAF